jgi:IclR family pca regulon transcriptional regulator
MEDMDLNDDAAVADEAEPAIDGRYIVPGLSRGLALLQLFTRRKPEQKLTEIAEGLGLSRSATYRLVYTLENDDFIRRDPVTRRYRLTAKVLSLGFEFLFAEPLTDIAQPFLRHLSDITGATAYLVVIEGWQVVHLVRVAPSATLITNLQIGARFPAHAVTSGRVILGYWDAIRLRHFFSLLKRECKTVAVPATFEAFQASLDKDRERGYAFSKSIFETAVSACACAIRDNSGASVAAISVVAPQSLFEDAANRRRVIEAVRETANRISGQLGFSG